MLCLKQQIGRCLQFIQLGSRVGLFTWFLSMAATLYFSSVFNVGSLRFCPSPRKVKKAAGPRQALTALKDAALKFMQEQQKLLILTQRALHRQCWRTMITYFYFANLNSLFNISREGKPWREERKHTLSSCGLQQKCHPAYTVGYLMTSFRPEQTRLNKRYLNTCQVNKNLYPWVQVQCQTRPAYSALKYLLSRHEEQIYL